MPSLAAPPGARVATPPRFQQIEKRHVLLVLARGKIWVPETTEGLSLKGVPHFREKRIIKRRKM